MPVLTLKEGECGKFLAALLILYVLHAIAGATLVIHAVRSVLRGTNISGGGLRKKGLQLVGDTCVSLP